MAILRQAELGTPIAELIREVGISEQAFYQWKRKFIGLEVAQAEQVKLMAEENSRIRWTLGDGSTEQDFRSETAFMPRAVATARTFSMSYRFVDSTQVATEKENR